MPEHLNDCNVVPAVKPLGEPMPSNIRERAPRFKKRELFECTCRIKGREIKCQFVNRSSSCVLYNHQVSGPEYYLDYVDKNGIQRTECNAWVETVCFPHLVALSPYPTDEMFPQGALHDFSIPVPPNCKKISSLTFLISYVSFSEMRNIENLSELSAAFMRNKAKVTATFE